MVGGADRRRRRPESEFLPQGGGTLDRDLQHIRLLAAFHYVLSAFAVVFGCLPVVHVIIGIALLSGAFRFQEGTPPPAILGWMFILLPGAFIVFSWILAVVVFLAAHKLSRCVSYRYCLFTGGLECLFVPFGTVLGVFTLIVLMRPSVPALFEASHAGNWGQSLNSE